MKKLIVILAGMLTCVSLMQAQTKGQGKIEQKGGLIAKATAHSVVLTWTQPTMQTGWTLAFDSVYKANGTCPQTTYTKIYASTAPVTTYTDTNVVGLATYCYVVTDTASCSTCSPSTGESSYSSPAQAIIPADPAPTPNPPSGLTTQSASLYHAPLLWNAPDPQSNFTIVKYRVYRGIKPSMPNPALIAVLNPSLLNYTDTKCKGTQYYYVKAYDKSLIGTYQTSVPSNIVQAICQ